jgi:hypothetical protein
MLSKNTPWIEVGVEGWAKEGHEGRNILSSINPTPLGGANLFLISGLRPTTGVYISIFKVDLVGNKRIVELGYEMDIVTFKMLFKLQIDSRYR